MNRASSRIFESYIKIAKEKGLLSEKKEEQKTDVSKYDPSKIEMLYGFKLDPNILEQAHPDTSILFPAHDKFNGVVENLEERQQKMLDVANRVPKPTYSQHLYISATDNLQQELLKLAMKLDAENKMELMSFADSCAQQLKKTAIAPLAVVGIGAALVALYGGLSQKYQFSQGVHNDAISFLTEAQEAITEVPQLKNDLEILIQQIQLLKIASEEVAKTEFNFKPSQDQEKLSEQALLAIKNKEDEKTITKLNGFKLACQELIKTIPDYISVLEMKKSQYESGHSSFFNPIYKLYRLVVPSNLEDVIVELNKLYTSVSEAPKQIDAQIKLLHKMRSTVDSLKKFKSILNPEEIKDQKLDLGAEKKQEQKPLQQLDLS